jgi:hypothetical protein
MKKKKAILPKEKPDEWVMLAQSIIDQQNFNYQNYDEERNSIVVSAKTYEKLKQISNEFRANNIV